MFNYHWKLKKNLSDKITDNNIDNFYNNLSYKHKILGGKLIGAGGGGFFLVCVKNKKKTCEIFDKDNINYLDFNLEANGSKIVIS